MSSVPPGGPVRLVTMSATYGAGGSLLARRLADRLGLRFDDRVISADTAAELESLTDEERASSPPSRWLSALARVAAMVPSAPVPMETNIDPVAELRQRSEQHISAAIAQGPTLFLGRAAAIALAGWAGAYHIRLDGPLDRRIARAMTIEDADEGQARRRCETTDRARSQFVRRLYGVDPGNPSHYHVVLDPTVLSGDDVVEILAIAATAFWSRH
ncbi:MAG: cytidylate kinase-like family protein [Ilumatobacteraceae bacterium]